MTPRDRLLTFARRTIDALDGLTMPAAAPPAPKAPDPPPPTEPMTVEFEKRAGKCGEILTFEWRADKAFKALRLAADDDHGGMGTKIRDVFVDERPNTPLCMSGILTRLYSPSARVRDFQLDTCMPGKVIQIQVEFLRDCSWWATLEGNTIP